MRPSPAPPPAPAGPAFLARIYEVFPLRCPECGSDMRILAFLTDPEPVGTILRHLNLPHTAPRLSPARGPPQAAFDLDADPVVPVCARRCARQRRGDPLAPDGSAGSTGLTAPLTPELRSRRPHHHS
ncbi:MAG TPA: hypothetical protein VMN39_06325 [Longimicrobiaceae bacterium]|nr:hypothetical protein [Longimicrobiaceae bacterium]